MDVHEGAYNEVEGLPRILVEVDILPVAGILAVVVAAGTGSTLLVA